VAEEAADVPEGHLAEACVAVAGKQGLAVFPVDGVVHVGAGVGLRWVWG
jgi:hypothetical protein